PQDSTVRRRAFGELLQVLLDRLAVVRGELAIDEVLGVGLLFLGQAAPLVGLAQIYAVDFSRPLLSPQLRILHRARRRLRSSPIAASLSVSPLLLLELLDQFVNRTDDALLHPLYARAAMTKIQPAVSILHLPGDLHQRLLLEVFEVHLHQFGDR